MEVFKNLNKKIGTQLIITLGEPCRHLMALNDLLKNLFCVLPVRFY